MVTQGTQKRRVPCVTAAGGDDGGALSQPRARSERTVRVGIRCAIAIAIVTWLVIHLSGEGWSVSIDDVLAIIALALIVLSIAMLFRAQATPH